MSAVKTLVPAPAPAPDTSRNARGAFMIPAPRTMTATGSADRAESSFQLLFASATGRQPNRSADSAVVSGKASEKAGKTKKEAPSEAADRASRSGRKPRDADRKKAPGDEQPETDEVSQASDAASGAQSSEATEEIADTPEAGESNAGGTQASDESQERQPADGAQDTTESARKAEGDARAELLRQLTPLGCGCAASQSGPGTMPAQAAGTETSGKAHAQAVLQRADTDAARTPEQAQPADLAAARQASVARELASNVGNPGVSVKPTGAALNVAAPSAASAGNDLARLLAIAAGLTDGGSSDSSGPQGGSDPASAQGAGTRQGGQSGADASGERGSALPAESPTATAGGTSKAESFAQLLARGHSTSRGPSANVERVAELVRANVGAKESSITLRLDPPELGRIQLDAKLHGDVLSIRIQAETLAARDLLHSRMNELRQALDRHGITIDRFDIEPRPASPSPNGHGPNDRGSGSQQQSAEGGMGGQGQPNDSSQSAHSGGDGVSTQLQGADGSGESGGGVPESEPSPEGIGTAASVTATSVNVLA